MDTSLPQLGLVLSQPSLQPYLHALPPQCFWPRTSLPEDLTFLMLMLWFSLILHLIRRHFLIVAAGQLELEEVERHTHS